MDAPQQQQAWLALLYLLAAVVQVKSAWYKTAEAHRKRRRALIQTLILHSRLPPRLRPPVERRFWVRWGRSSAWWDHFNNGVVADEEWRENFCVSKSSLLHLSERLRPRVEGRVTNMRAPVDVVTKVACTLYYLRDGGRLRKTANAFGLSRQAVSLIVRRVCTSISVALGPELIRKPHTEAEVKDLVENFHRSHDVPQCLGAIDCTHIQVKRPPVDSTNYTNSMRSFSMNVQALCDHKYCFMDVVVKWPGSVNDGHIFTHSKLCDDLKEGKIPSCPKVLLEDEDAVPVFVVGDQAYPLRPYVMKEYPDGGVTPQQQCFGRALSKAHAVIGSSLSRLKARFAALRRAMYINIDDLPFVIYACFVLHNYCELHGQSVSEQNIRAALQCERDCEPPATAVTANSDETEGERVRRVLTLYLDA